MELSTWVIINDTVTSQISISSELLAFGHIENFILSNNLLLESVASMTLCFTMGEWVGGWVSG